MKVLFIASNPDEQLPLNLDTEITEVARRYLAVSDDPPNFVFLPKLNVEDLQATLLRFKPDILHISAHGEREYLELADQHGNIARVTPDILRAFLPPDFAPRLIYLSACKSNKIAAQLVRRGVVPMAIGTTNSIPNHAAVASAVSFYGSLLSGLNVADAFEGAKRLIETLTKSKVTATLYPKDSIQDTLSSSFPQLIADFGSHPHRMKQDDHYHLRLGIKGCPSTTIQVSFLTDDEDFINDYDTLENDLSLIVRDVPVRGILWSPKDTPWRAIGDHRLFAIGIKAGGGCFTVSGTLAEAIENRYRLAQVVTPQSVECAIEDLRQHDGAELNPNVYDKKRSKKKRKE